MASNSLGNIIKVTSYGESHGEGGTGVVIDGFPAGFPIDMQLIRKQLDRRKPGQSPLSTDRKENDQFRFLSGVFEGMTTGHPICIHIPNTDSRSSDYDHLKEVYRPSHADYVYERKYGIRDHRGGGRSSARITAAWVAAGALCEQWLKDLGIDIVAYTEQIHKIRAVVPEVVGRSQVDQSLVRCPDPEASVKMEELVAQMKEEGDSVGGIIGCRVYGLPAGLGDPVFAKLNATLSHALFSINAVKGVEIGGGFDMATKKGSEVNDAFESDESIRTTTNFSGGIQGGISNGETVSMRIAFKPTATIRKSQNTVNKSGDQIKLEASGRHDPCVLPRAVPIVESMVSLVIADHVLLHRSSKI